MPPDSPRPLCRRRFVVLLGLAAGGLAYQRQPGMFRHYLERARDFLDSVEVPNLNLAAISPPLTGGYSAFLAAANLQNVAIPTILAPHHNQHGSVRNSLPPENLWKNILPTLQVVDRLARELGQRVRINSAYRSPEYNATCPGAVSNSQHLQNRAIDLSFASPPAVVAALARRLRESGVFRGGVGLYPSFVHIDTRGRNTDW